MNALDPGFGRAVQHTRELTRVVALPRRLWTEESAEQVAREMTELLKKPGGTMTLRGVQAQALLEAGIKGGLFGPIGVGQGKTLLSFLVFYVLGARRPLLVLPAKLIEKTKREMRALMTHWKIPNFIRIVSYEWLGRVQAQTFLERDYQPDVLVLDEGHKVKNPKAAVTKRIDRYKKNHPDKKFVVISGTPTKRSIKDWAHVIRWCLPPSDIPLPQTYTEIEDWADALDEKTTGESRLDVGALVVLCNAEERKEKSQLSAVRKAYRRRLVETMGVVATTEGNVDCSLIIEALEVELRKEVDEAFHLLRKDWTTPDGWPLTDPLQLWKTARELSLGFYYRWEPRPPHEWMAARKEVSRVVREIHNNNRRNLDSLLMVVRAIDDGYYPEAKPALDDWRLIERTFTPNTVPVWLDDSLIRAAGRWAIETPGIVWVEHRAFAQRLAKETKLSYYGRKGLDERGRFIEDHPKGESLIASVASNAEGRNLQFKWHRNLITSCPANGLQWEQILGRTHRFGQEADEVEFQVFLTSIEHALAFEQSLYDARYAQDIGGQVQKLLYADKIYPAPEELILRPGHRWNK